MNRFIAVAVAAVAFAVYAEPPSGEVKIRLRKGTVRTGRIVTETSTGYLLAGPRGSMVVPFKDIVEITPVEPEGETVPAPEPEPASTRSPAPPPAGQYPPAAPPPYQPAPPPYQPAPPAYQPAQPAYQPAQPAYQPAAPGAPSAYSPAAPSAYPPAAPPAPSAYQPAAPSAYQPAAAPPTYQPASSAYQPVSQAPSGGTAQNGSPYQPPPSSAYRPSPYASTSPPPAPATLPPTLEATGRSDQSWVEKRKGFRFGLGLIVSPVPVLFSTWAQFHFDWTFSRTVGLRVTPGVGIFTAGRLSLLTNVDTQVLINLGKVYSFGVGLQIGFSYGYGATAYLGPTLSPVILKLGEEGRHQLALQVSVPVLQLYFTPLSSFGGFTGGLSYAYLF